ncbi:hypothetical protein [Caldisphaera sp.]|uniref:hypothetical protein n=1 Tax=Caldisphaera sp. TaxID=2060322 RepID=UPI003D13E73E
MISIYIKKFDYLKLDIKTIILIKKVSRLLKMISFLMFIILIYLIIVHKFFIVSLLSLISILFFFSDFWIPEIWLKILNNGIEYELPSLLAFLIPYASTTRNLIDLLLTMPDSLKLKYIKKEIERLKIILNFTQDSRKALSKLGETTPNLRFKRLIVDYVQSEYMGTSKNKIAMLLYKYAIYGIRDGWKNYIELGKEFVEISIGIILSIGVLAILILFNGSNLLFIVLVFGLFFIPLISILLLLLRPKIGEPQDNYFVEILSIVFPLISSFFILKSMVYFSLIPLIIGSIILEFYYRETEKRIDIALSNLRTASEKAKIGKRFDVELNRAKLLANNIIQAILESEKIAGKIGVSNAIEGIRLIIEESRRLSNSIKAQSIFMMSIAIISPLISIFAINIISSTFLNSYQFIPINYNMFSFSKIIIASLSPLTVLPISILYRGKIPTLIPSLLSTLLVILLLR